ncbi:hypothetical protein H4Q26_017450 [Puccinia striiformis f. sp. tritici PST-130]|uniref:Uncharacterized protein n=2 Tax=Puccinia striiformis TaxID=27350 RepID=A0A0L0VMT4_9BASI|nr:hypothetical protein H4Q26_017450 [Puccinia striiformis f. sp. tritici PST-130]KNF00566.1 hypothetical protein PSTG_06259 [Puccinia striiformis f. sp. tritici PST-78]
MAEDVKSPVSSSNPAPSTTRTGKGIDTTNNNPQFISSDYQHICSYLEDDEKFSDLYGDKKTDVGPKVLTKKAAFEIFAIYVNAHSNKQLLKL